MDRWMFCTILLCILLCLGLVQNQDNKVLEPRNLRIYSNNSLQQLLLEWDVKDEAYNSKIDIVFNIQIRLGEEDKRIILNVNYRTVLNKSRQHHQWNFISEVPLQCATHEARIRSRVASSKIWSSWTDWVAAKGPDALSNETIHVFPEEKVFERGSNITFCCIAKKNKHVTSFTFYDDHRVMETKRRIVLLTKKPASYYPRRFQLTCGFNDTSESVYLYLTRQPDKPKNLSCETEDMINIRCSWDPGYVDTPYYFEEVCPMKFILSDVSSTKIYCSTNIFLDNNSSCSFKRDNQFLYNLKLTSRNCLGQKHGQLSFNVTHRVRPVIIGKPSADHLNATFIRLSWQIKPINAKLPLLCQINVGKNMYNITAQSDSDSHFHFQLGGLKPATNYKFKVRCAVSPFWKWSSWTKNISAETTESAPSGLLDVWRHINSGLEQRNVTVYWRESSDFRANGKIQKYHLSWENLEDPSVQHHNHSVSAPQNCTKISLGNRSYKILVWAQNRAATSSPSVIIIPATDKNGKALYSEETTDKNEEHKIYISWKRQSKFSQYVVDWCNQPRDTSCDFQWKKYGGTKSSDLITSDAFKPGVRYTFNVYGIQGDRSYLLEKKAKYLEEMEPPHYLSCNIDTITANSLRVTWEQYDQKFSSGFIRGYMLYMKMDNQNCSVQGSKPLIHPGNLMICSYKIEKPNQTEFTVRHLKPNTKYLFALQAYAVNPNYTDNVFFTPVFTPDDGKWLFNLLYLLLVIPLVVMCICSRKNSCVRNCLCPAVPQPKVTPFFKMSLGITEVNDMIPNQLVMLEKPQEFDPKQSTLGILLENMTYSQSTYYPEVQIEERRNQKFNSGVTSYKPLQDFGFTSSPNPCTPEASLYSKDNLNYLYQTEVLPSMIQGTDSSCSVHWLDYRPQCSITSRRNIDY
ncbi:oncostatin-M-specific receptor subunit beta [Ahaetulla prasina]|uniref:oncostatin-M-specific receptor subunit beta n=1 Tax=Ahaetulla prasina TaxID=499056 RepID=UPI002648D5E1|nr:oncostatin-M-specific receptor subunit beta [Ahaetulla prasina]XP_058026655.1 oncostatin-M-specific receptor subunit beta [Ahaetulla prasina]XP_058026656.1 oncostatin-M-specific receptor subunit beta [Ahaetulla prasina]XP_058026657.1 oncostatin-M-specific receptor subunit beta [Ahaetulla prasina]XP_058026658.1 oncostatin-M-specific receptor subunit beta [Ahaetulla prasina]XP_058026659.1 oncostatin-M-specific receptor subunit beta [Ahaetulla prasina]XP_058026660.1 oncostatin-M-specific rece